MAKRAIKKEEGVGFLELPEGLKKRVVEIMSEARKRQGEIENLARKDVGNIAVGFLADKDIPEGYDAVMDEGMEKIVFIKRK